MREIKFRGRRVFIPHEWVYGSLLIDFESAAHDGRRITAIAYFDRFQRIAEVDPETVGQSTGLKDNNGKEIYEGDILGWMCGGVGQGDGTPAKSEVYFDRYKFAVRTGRTSFGWKLSQAAEVIGNIHENPELLEDK